MTGLNRIDALLEFRRDSCGRATCHSKKSSYTAGVNACKSWPGNHMFNLGHRNHSQTALHRPTLFISSDCHSHCSYQTDVYKDIHARSMHSSKVEIAIYRRKSLLRYPHQAKLYSRKTMYMLLNLSFDLFVGVFLILILISIAFTLHHHASHLHSTWSCGGCCWWSVGFFG